MKRVIELCRSLLFAKGRWVKLAILLGVVVPAYAVPWVYKDTRPVSVSGNVVVPEQFLRPWDPITVFFDRDRGPNQPAPEDAPQRLVKLSKAHAGAWSWLDKRTLQFRPAEPWPALSRYAVTLGDNTTNLVTLMASPTATVPVAGADNLSPVDAITLTFPEPVDVSALARMISIELRELPGSKEQPQKLLDANDFSIKALPRSARNDSATYVLQLDQPIAFGMRATVRLKLSLDESVRTSLVELSFATAEPFRIVDAGCSSLTLPFTASGASYGREQALRCNSSELQVRFSAHPAALSPIEGRNFVQIVPPVAALSYHVRGQTVAIFGRFLPDTTYKVTVAPVGLRDLTGRTLTMTGPSSFFVLFPRQTPALSVPRGNGVVERFGPQRLPLQGRGYEKVDLRIFRIDALDRNFWPFPAKPLVVDEATRPPGPGEEPESYKDAQPIGAAALLMRLRGLGAPPVSTLVDLPKTGASTASFGLDLSSYLTRLSGKNAPGTYLVGVRRIDQGNERYWTRLQATDLSLSTLEEPSHVRFVVTSLASGEAVKGAVVTIEGAVNQTWKTFTQGTTDSDGAYVWQPSARDGAAMRRIVVAKDDDKLVIDPSTPPDGYADNQWFPSRETWLQWTQYDLSHRSPPSALLCHLFTERPVYRPEEQVHIKGYVRERDHGRLRVVPVDGQVVVRGPGDLAWQYPTKFSSAGSFYHEFKENNLPTGSYVASVLTRDNRTLCQVGFTMEAYRLPEFEVLLHSQDEANLDAPFEVRMTASYYAGGKVSGRPIRWRVTQFPYTWTPGAQPGFVFSTDGRFSGRREFTASPKLERIDTTDEQGTAVITIDPTVESSAAPRSYIVEATVIGANDQTVSSTRRITALPPFVLGLKVPRTLLKAKSVEPEVIAAGPSGKLISGQKITVRLVMRQWHSHLAAGDFVTGVPQYVTDVVDEKVAEKVIESRGEPIKVPFALPRAGVYIVELEARDKLGRTSVVAMDFFAAGDEPVAWSKPDTQGFSVATDKDSYDPGDTARIVLKSPFQNAMALAVVEAPDGNQYTWLPVKGAQAVFQVPITGAYVPRLPVHFLLMRGRVADTTPLPGGAVDLGKPSTRAATAWLAVTPLDNQVEVKLSYPEKALPGSKVAVTINLKTAKDKKPLSGEVTLWLVDQAVLALGSEQRLDPVPDFITDVTSRLVARDTRNDVIGDIPFYENPGGDGDEKALEGADLLDNVTVRRDFRAVPYFNPAIMVGPSGATTVTVKLPDNLTNFKLRAKVVSGAERFGVGTGMIAVRLPLIVQPALPRFVRPGDEFIAVGIGRVVEGVGGPGAAEVRVTGLKATASTSFKIDWQPNSPRRIEVPVQVLTPTYDNHGNLTTTDVTLKMAATRHADKASDAFEVRLPLRDDRLRIKKTLVADLIDGKPVALPRASEAARSGTVLRDVMVARDATIVKMASALDFLVAYPHGCTEQRLSRARAQLAVKQLRALLSPESTDQELARGIQQTLEHVARSVDSQGLVAYWPGGKGYVSLTAWVVELMVEAKEAKYPVDAALLSTLVRSLGQALRSDYGHFVDGEAWQERAWALSALASAGKYERGYADELAQKARLMSLEGATQVLLAMARVGQGDTPLAQELVGRVRASLHFRLYQGHEQYAGLQEQDRVKNALILSSETRSIAEVIRALYRVAPQEPRLPVLVDALVTLGRDDGWGSTNANAAALLALTEALKGKPGDVAREVAVAVDGKDQRLKLEPSAPVAHLHLGTGNAAEVRLVSGASAVLRSELSYVPLAPGSTVAAEASGFVVRREYRQLRPEGPPDVTVFDTPSKQVKLTSLDVIEDHVQVVNPTNRHYIAVIVPLAAGMEPLNPALATAPPEAKPSAPPTLAPTYVAFMDDHVGYFYDTLPKGTYDFYFRTRATTPGTFTQPPAHAEMMYDLSIRGQSAGARIEIARPKGP